MERSDRGPQSQHGAIGDPDPAPLIAAASAPRPVVGDGAFNGGSLTPDAVAALWQEHRGWVAAVLYAHMPHRGGGHVGGADVNDLLQEVAMSLIASINTLKSPENIGPWLRTVAINVARDAGRRFQVRRNTMHAGDALDAMPAKRDARAMIDESARDRGRRALDIINDLPADYREPLLLSLRGLSHKQIGLVLDLPPSTIETRLFRARAMVRRELSSVEVRDTTEANDS